MKKLIALLLAMTLVLSLTACGGGEQTANLDDAPETSAITTTTDGAEETTENTEETTAPVVTEPAETEPVETEPAETTPPATEPAETTPVHTHSYTSKVTKAATCTEKGVKTFTCSCGKSYTESIKATGHSYSATTTKEATCTEKGSKTLTCKCGSSYTEEIKAKGHSHTVTDSKKVTCTEDGYTKYSCACGDTYTTTETAKGHSMSGWETYTASTNNAPGEKRNSCANCDYYESEMQYDRMFKHYADIASGFEPFTSVQQLQNQMRWLIYSAWRNGVSFETNFDSTVGAYMHTIPVASMDAYTSKYFGATYDYTGVSNLSIPFESTCSYDAATESLVITAYPVGGEGSDSNRDVTFTTEDNIHFTVNITTTITYPDMSTGTSHSVITVVLTGGKYIITSFDYLG